MDIKRTDSPGPRGALACFHLDPWSTCSSTDIRCELFITKGMVHLGRAYRYVQSPSCGEAYNMCLVLDTSLYFRRIRKIQTIGST